MSRELADLLPKVRTLAEKHIALCAMNGIHLLVTCTLRSNQEQAALYAQGRTKPGKIVTNAKPGSSWHNYGRAYDVVPIVNGKPVWGTSGKDLELWKQVGFIGKSVGLEWAGDWVRFREFPHFQLTEGMSLSQAALAA